MQRMRNILLPDEKVQYTVPLNVYVSLRIAKDVLFLNDEGPCL